MQTTLILDTNVVLDWLVFADPLLQPFQSAVSNQRVVLLTHPIALNELQRVLNYPNLKLSAEVAAQVMASYASHTVAATVPEGFSNDYWLLPHGFPRCSDADDQIFLALAYHGNAVLVSRDHAVLKLKKRAVKFGVSIIEVDQLL